MQTQTLAPFLYALWIVSCMLRDVPVADLGFPRHGGMHENERNWIEKDPPRCTIQPRMDTQKGIPFVYIPCVYWEIRMLRWYI